jgi:FKBP-type peptidyl-prolyl cis-trans isomerase (trigger factor)
MGALLFLTKRLYLYRLCERMIKTTVKKLEKSEVAIEGVIEASVFMSYEDKALAHIGSRMELPGFRPGKVPAEMVKQNINDMMLLEEMAERAITSAYAEILEQEKIDAIGRPEISITKIARGNDLEFTIKTAVLPEINLPDYTKIAKDENANEEYKKEIVIEEADIEKVLLDLRKMRAHQDLHKDDAPGAPHTEHPEPEEKDLPVVDDEFAKSIGKFENVAELKAKVAENLKTEKEAENKDKRRLAIIEKLLEQTSAEIPEILTTSEEDKLLYRLEADVTQMGFKFDEYLKQVGKTEADLRKEWKPEAEKRAKLAMIIHRLMEKENLKPSDEEIQKEVDVLLNMYKDADPIRARAYVEQMMGNEKVFNFLESL